MSISTPQYAMTMTYDFPMVFAEDITASVDRVSVEKTVTDYLAAKNSGSSYFEPADYSQVLAVLEGNNSFEFSWQDVIADESKPVRQYFQQEVLNDYLASQWQPVVDGYSTTTISHDTFIQPGVIIPANHTPCYFWFQACSAVGWQPKFNYLKYLENLVEKPVVDTSVKTKPVIRETVVKTAGRVTYRPGVIAFSY